MPARQYDAWDLGMTTNDDFTNADVNYEESLPRIRTSLMPKPGQAKEVPIVTGFLGRGLVTGGCSTALGFSGGIRKGREG